MHFSRAFVITLLSLALAACVGAEADPATTSPPASTSTSAGGETPTTTTSLPPAYAPEPAEPVGVLPSLNESGGCGAAQGIRGPYASLVSASLEGDEAVRGPWGDVYGRDLAEVRSHLVSRALPMTGDEEVVVWVHEAVAPALDAAIANLEADEAAGRYYEIRAGDVSSFRPETVAPKRYLSFHAVGAAVDINASTNHYRADNVLVSDFPDWFVKAWTDAGWCWGGDWQTVKDAMHFSWQGPLYTAGSARVPAAPRTEPSRFRRSLTFSTVLGPAPAGARQFVSDLDRDGAPDAVRVHPWTADGRLGVEIAQGMYGFAGACTPLVTSPVAPGAAFLMADGTADGRPDLWEIDGASGEVVVTIHTLVSGFSERLAPRRTGLAAAESVFLAADHDGDGITDLYVLEGGSLQVRAGPGFTSSLVEVSLDVGTDAGWRFALGDDDLDGVPDLYALSPDGPARLVIVPGADGFTGEPQTRATEVAGQEGAFAVGDLDGDGRGDLYFLDERGVLSVYLGGNRSNATEGDLTYWFVEGNDQPTTRQEACPLPPAVGGL